MNLPDHYRQVDQQTEFEQLWQHLATCQVLALDTEFVRTRTLLPKLGLLQVFDGEQIYLIDPLPLSDLSPFADLLSNPSIVKVLHACSEDMEVFLSHFDVAPAPVFDTQFAANLLAMGPSLGYARLVESECEVTLDKGESRTDWLARPLSDRQLHYAANDVSYLYQIYTQLVPRLSDANLVDVVYQEMAMLAQKKAAKLPEQSAYLAIGNVWKLNPQQRYVMQKLAAWRLKLARQKDIAINFIIKEPHLLAVAMHCPTDKRQLSAMKVLLPQEIRRYSDHLVGIVNQALARFEQEPEQCQVDKIRRLNDIPQYKKQLSELKKLVQQAAVESNIAAEIIASKKQLNQLLKWWWFECEETSAQGLQPDLISGWRGALLQARIQQILGPSIREI